MNTQQQNEDGSWTDAEPMGPIGLVAQTEFKLRSMGFNRIANLLARWDERKLG